MERVTVYTARYCAWCDAARELFRRKRVYIDEVDVTGDHVMREKLIAMTGGARTVPQIWIGNRYIGGFRDLVRLDEDGQLDALLGLTGSRAAAMESP
ncbi:MAG: glutaredoxin [Myxococcaceae bacterium]|nr:glutaredoxin [Myxococcaceae bacterium]